MNLNRASAALVALLLSGLLAAAAMLVPDPAGLGTHQQLGLPPCSLIVMFGVRCPSCGMTTSWAYFMNGQWASSAEANFAGFLLAMLAFVSVIGLVRTVVTGTWPSRVWQWRLCWVLVAVMVIALAQWGWRLSHA